MIELYHADNDFVVAASRSSVINDSTGSEFYMDGYYLFALESEQGCF